MTTTKAIRVGSSNHDSLFVFVFMYMAAKRPGHVGPRTQFRDGNNVGLAPVSSKCDEFRGS
jgi:hypothetical protein